MSVKSLVSVAVLAACTGLGASVASAAISIPTVPIGHAANAPDPLTGNMFGSVAYSYNIGVSEVTNGQYAAFLGAVARTDTHNLYSVNMGGAFGGITRSGSPGVYTYATVSGRANHPVNFVSYWDSLRFANWLHNGQPTGNQTISTTESGAYTLTTGTIAANSVVRSPAALWALTSENEWYKAAYFQPPGHGSPVGNYWLYPHSSNTVTQAQANYAINGIGLFNTTAAGSFLANFYGTHDMGGNVWEWNQSIPGVNRRGVRGGSFLTDSNGLWAYSTGFPFVGAEEPEYGFRVVQIPEPSFVALVMLGGLVTVRLRRGS